MPVQKHHHHHPHHHHHHHHHHPCHHLHHHVHHVECNACAGDEEEKTGEQNAETLNEKKVQM